MNGNAVQFTSMEDLDNFFREGRTFFSDEYVRKLPVTSAYFNRVPSQPWPSNSSIESKAFRFGRGYYDVDKPFQSLVSGQCQQNSCDLQVETIARPGTESYTYSLMRRYMVTEWFCVDDLLYRLFPAEEIMQIENTNIRITRTVHDEFTRSQWIGASGHKWIGIADDDNIYCGELDDESWYVPQWSGEFGGYDMARIRVKLDASELENISYLSTDMLDEALVDLQLEDEAYRLDLINAVSAPMLEVLVPDAYTARDLFYSLKDTSGNWNSTAGFDDKFMMRRLGIAMTIGNYAIGYDITAPRYNVDTVFNANLPTFDENDVDTWPALIRVPIYLPVLTSDGYGCKYVQNKDYKNADFAITVVYVPNAVTKFIRPDNTGYGQVQMGSHNYAGDWKWFRPIDTQNFAGIQGRFQANFTLSMQVKDPTIMHTFLHRRNKRKVLKGACCPLNSYVTTTDPDCFVCTGSGS